MNIPRFGNIHLSRRYQSPPADEANPTCFSPVSRLMVKLEKALNKPVSYTPTGNGDVIIHTLGHGDDRRTNTFIRLLMKTSKLTPFLNNTIDRKNHTLTAGLPVTSRSIAKHVYQIIKIITP